MKRSLFVILVIIAVSMSAQATVVKYSGGSGTPSDPYKISTPADMNQIGKNTADWNKCFKLTADINLSAYTGTQFSRIGTNTNAFSGVFDGNGHTISGFTYTAASSDYIGVFGDINAAGTVKNVFLVDVSVTGQGHVGGLAGHSEGTISYCNSAGTVSGSSDYVGGLVGYNRGGSISNCYSTGTVSGDSSYVGGLVGYNDSDSDINNCYSTGTVTGGDNSGALGGLVGENDSDISNCYSTGTVSGGSSSQFVGGLVGDNEGDINNCYSTGTVSGSSDSYDVGGLVGYNYGDINNCYSTGSVSGSSDDFGGLVGFSDGDINNCYFLVTSGPNDGNGVPLTDTQMKQQSSFVGWDFVGETANGTDDIWTINEGVSYPKLTWQPPCTAPSAPTGVLASDGSYTNKVQVTWDSVSGATGYEVWRGNTNDSNLASKLGDYTSPFDDSSVTPDTTYYYWVKAKNDCGPSDFSLPDSGNAHTTTPPPPPPPCTLPSAPTGVSASDGTYTDKVRVTWNSVSGATGYEVWRSASNSSSSASKLGDYTSPFDDSSATPGTTYYYWVKAGNSCGTSGFSSSDSGYATCAVSSAPTGVSASDGTYTNKVQVTWGSVSGATGYEVWRNTSNSSGSASKLGDSNTSPFDDSNVTPGTTYYYWVKTKNTCGTSDFSSSDPGSASITSPKIVSITKCTVTAGSKDNPDTISFSGTMNATADDFNNDNVVVTINSSDMVSPLVRTFPIAGNFKKGKFNGSASNASFALDTKTSKFSFTARSVDLSGLYCPLTVQIKIGDSIGTTQVDEAVVNGGKPIPINLLMGVKNSLRVDKPKFTRNKKTNQITQVALSGGFSVKDAIDMTTNSFSVSIGTQTFTIPTGKFKNTKGKFTCSKVKLAGGEIAAATFDTNKCTFTLTIKGTKITDPKGAAEFKMEFGAFSEGAEVSLP